MRVLILSHRDVVAALPPRACAESMAAVLAARARGETYMPLRSIMAAPGAAGFMGLMPSWRGEQPDHGAMFALKAICVIPDNPARGLDAHQGTVTLFDGEAGPAGTELAAAASAEDAVRGADVVVAATNASEPVLQRGWLKPGAHVNAVGASTPRAKEIDTATVAASALFCDSRESVLAEAGEFRLAVTEGLIGGEEHIRAELGEVLAGTAAGRRDDGELTLFRSLGIAVEDLAAAETAVAAARAQGLGSEVEL